MMWSSPQSSSWADRTPLRGERPGDRGPESVDSKIERLLDASLARLGMDYVDLYIYHMWDWNTPIEELLPALDRQVRAGKIRTLGISNCYAWQLAEANVIARANGWTPFSSYQGHYNAIAREDEREMVPLAATHGLALTPYSALAGGRLAKRLARRADACSSMRTRVGSTTARRTWMRPLSRPSRALRRPAA